MFELLSQRVLSIFGLVLVVRPFRVRIVAWGGGAGSSVELVLESEEMLQVHRGRSM